MTENKLYAQCREEARKQLEEGYLPYTIRQLNQLTAEIYGIKLLDMSQPKETEKDYYLKGDDAIWFKTNINNSINDDIGSTQDLHDHFVREFNKE